jgi:hypothetical protein
MHNAGRTHVFLLISNGEFHVLRERKNWRMKENRTNDEGNLKTDVISCASSTGGVGEVHL